MPVPSATPELVSTGEADLATSFSAVTSWAATCQEGTPFEGEAMENLRVLVGRLDQYYFGPITPAGSGIDSLREVLDNPQPVDLVSQGAEELKSANASMSSFDPESAWTQEATGGVQLHLGAEQYFQDAGLMD